MKSSIDLGLLKNQLEKIPLHFNFISTPHFYPVISKL